MLVFLDRQHAGKPDRRADRGAWGDLDGDGQRDVWEQEAMLTGHYLLAAETRLLELGHTVLPISDGTYRDRHARVNTYARGAPAVYVAGHINAGGGDYGMVFHGGRSRPGARLAELVAGQLLAECPELAQVDPKPARPDDWTRNAYATIRGVGPVAICLEPGFLDYPGHASLFSDPGLVLVGRALAHGIDAWATEQS